MRRMLKRRLKKLFDVETAPHGWDVRVWPTNWRLYYKRKPTTGGVEKRVGVYQLTKGEAAFEWWVSL